MVMSKQFSQKSRKFLIVADNKFFYTKIAPDLVLFFIRHCYSSYYYRKQQTL